MTSDRYFPKVRQETLAGLVAHNPENEQGERFVFADAQSLPEGNLYVVLRRFGDIREAAPYVRTHTHKHPSLWLFFGCEADLSGLQIEVTLAAQSQVKQSPVSVWIPAGMPHSYRPISGRGYYVNILFAPQGDYNRDTSDYV